jgi:hypothetical protein
MATTLAPERTRDCIDACAACAVACHACADRCTRQADPQMLTCIRLCLSCADACLACLPSLAREANYEQLCRACADLCDACVVECERYDDPAAAHRHAGGRWGRGGASRGSSKGRRPPLGSTAGPRTVGCAGR